MPHCPDCHTDQVIKNGSIHTGKQKYACNACGRQFVDDSQFRIISDETTALIDRLLLEKIALAGIARAVQVSESWLQAYVNAKYQNVPREVRVRAKKRPIDDCVRRDGVVCGPQREQAVDLVGHRPRHAGNCRRCDRCAGCSHGTHAVGIVASRLPPVCRGVERLLGGVYHDSAVETPSGGGKGQWADQP